MMTSASFASTQRASATALKTFNDRYAKETLDWRTVVKVMSDGYDTDSPEALAVELRRLERRAQHLVWRDRLLEWKGYAPVARANGGRPQLGLVDCFATAHSAGEPRIDRRRARAALIEV